MNTIQAIETEYRGYRFRSRLEARWAVFFSTLGVPYEYEPEGFELGNGVRYLPDFWLPTWDAWVEVKPNMDACDTGRAMDRLSKLAENTGKLGLLLIGEVWPGTTDILLARPKGYWEGTSYTRISQCSLCDGICLEKTFFDGKADGTDDLGFCNVGPHTCEYSDIWPTNHATTVMAAYKAARQARFEFGQQRKENRRRPSG